MDMGCDGLDLRCEAHMLAEILGEAGDDADRELLEEGF